MKTVLITGGIGSGKSEAARYLASLGYGVYDSDSRAKDLYVSVPGLLERIGEAIGCPGLRLPDGSLDRAALAAAIFRDPEKRKALEDILYPVLLENFLLWRSCREDEAAVFFESAVAGGKSLFDGLFDIILEIRCDREVRLERVLGRNPGVSRDDVLSRMLSQEAPAAADEVIVNDGDIAALHDKIDNFLKKI